MSGKQWLLITFVVILNIVIFAVLLGGGETDPRAVPTPTRTPHPTFTPAPLPTATAILMPTEAAPGVGGPSAPAGVHVVREGETLEAVAAYYDIPVPMLRALNHLPAGSLVVPGQRLAVPTTP